MLVSLLIGLTATAAPLEQVKPRKVVEQALLTATATDGTTAVALPDGQVWVGTRKLRAVGALPGPADGLHVSHGAVTAWHTKRAGLCVETTVHTWSTAGEELHAMTGVGAPISAAARPGAPARHALLWRDHVDLIPVTASKPTRLVLPLGQPIGLSTHNGGLQVDGTTGPLLQLDAEGCPTGLEDDPAARPLARLRTREARRACTDPPRLPRDIEAQAEAALDALQRDAISRGDAEALAQVGGLSCDAIEQQRPAPSDDSSAFAERFDRQLPLRGRLDPRGQTAAVVREFDPATELRPWVDGPWAPACAAKLILVASDPAKAAVLGTRLDDLQRQGASCAGQAIAAAPDELGAIDEEDGAPGRVLYVTEGVRWAGIRRGSVSWRMVRMDLARLAPGDPLHRIARASELTPSWSKGPGPGGPVIIDVDGSWVASAGWDLVRGPPNAIREERVSLNGPIVRLQGRRDGRFEVVSGGQVARVALEGRQVEWAEQRSDTTELLPIPPPLPPRSESDSGPWRIVGDGRIGGRTKDGNVTIDLGVAIERVYNGRIASVVVTPVGLVGVGPDGSLRWRLTEVDQWVWTDAFVVGTSPWGIQGYRLPY